MHKPCFTSLEWSRSGVSVRLAKGRRVVEKNAGLAAHFVRPVDPVYGRCVWLVGLRVN